MGRVARRLRFFLVPVAEGPGNFCCGAEHAARAMLVTADPAYLSRPLLPPWPSVTGVTSPCLGGATEMLKPRTPGFTVLNEMASRAGQSLVPRALDTPRYFH
jgi:hypothetical protein